MQSLGNFTIPVSSSIHAHDATDNETHFAGVVRATLVRPLQLPDREHTTQAVKPHSSEDPNFKRGQALFTTGYDSISGGQGGGNNENQTTYVLAKTPSFLHPFSQSLCSLCFLIETLIL